MFRRYPYWGWLLLSVVLWSVNIVHYRAHRQAMLPAEMARAVNSDLNRREQAFQQFTSNSSLLRRIFADSLTEEEARNTISQPFLIYCYSNDTLRFWNNNSIVAPLTDTIPQDQVLRRYQGGTYVRKQVPLNGGKRQIVVLFPVQLHYPLENDYLHAHFLASEHIPVKTRLTRSPTGGADEYKIIMLHGVVAGYLVFNPSDIQKWQPDGLLLLMLFLAILATVAWVQHMAMHITRKRPKVFAFLIVLSVILATRISLYLFGLPFQLDTLTFFSPRLYASSVFLTSLGDLFINILLALWAITFISRHTPYKAYFKQLRSGPLKVAVAFVVTGLLVAYTFFFLQIIRSLILDSSISFDVTHFYAINIYTVFGLLAIILVAAISCMVIYLLNVQLNTLTDRKIKFATVFAVALLYCLLLRNFADPFTWNILAGLLLFIFLLDIPGFSLASKLFEPHMIIWALIICGFCTLVIRYFNDLKEHATRTAFVEQHLAPQHDNYIESTFNSTAKKIERDPMLKNFFYHPAATARRVLDQHFDAQYFTGAVNKYQVKMYLFDAHEKPLNNKDTSSYSTLYDEKTESSATESPYLFYKESVLDRHYYISYMPIYSDTINNIIGYVIIDLDLKKPSTETVYPELLQPIPDKSVTGDNDYAYAVYINDNLVTQTNDYSFPVHLRNDTLKDQQYLFGSFNGLTGLYYKVSEKRTVVVVHYHSELIEAITLFSYLFGIQIIIALVIFLYQLYLSNVSARFFSGKLAQLTLRRRVHLSMLLVVFVSFVVIGYVTIQFFSNEYRESNATRLQSAMEVAKQSVKDYLTTANAFNTNHIFDTVGKSAQFKYFLTGLANTQKIDINIFDDEGDLFATSQDEIYDKGLISRKMRPDAYYEMAKAGRSRVIQNEQVGDLSYISAYQPLRDEHGNTLGYINVPFFSSEKDLDFQISNILVTLINLYAFIFLVSSLLTVVVTKWITRTFDLITSQFDKLNLERNERIEWAADDEIGKLVREYNKMVKKVEENATRLAQSERESAWREMAKQVAHEIKNPLTPMKLNIQYLQQATRNNHPNLQQLIERVSESIIEQIDNLSYIASEFSDFAKMPEAKPEELDPTDLLGKAVELYSNHEMLTLELTTTGERTQVVADKSQLLRVFTNLLENAKQAIPEGRHGLIKVCLAQHTDHILITIADNGTGISEIVSKRIFQPYFTTKSSGTGLGLAMTKKIIEFWQGAIWFETVEGEGTSFFIRLPAVPKA